MDRFDRCVAQVLRHEGGFVDHPSDPGGATNLGITIATLSAWRGKPCTPADVRALGEAEARAIYRAHYWTTVHGDDLPAGVDLAVFDAAVMSGPGNAARWLQRALGVPVDGAIGPVTLRAAAATDAEQLALAVCRERRAFLAALSTWAVFGKGWSTRVSEVASAATAMARGARG